jgi:drug/metabolite transporter (DMT)-like permease
MSTPPSLIGEARPMLAIVLAFAVIYIIWGTTYLGITLSLQTLPPFLSGAIRFITAGGLMLVWVLLQNPGSLRDVPFGTAVLAGVLLSGIGNGFVIVAQQGVPSGVAALVVSAIPGIVLLFDALFFSRRRPGLAPMLGVLIALAGVGLLSSDVERMAGHATPLHVVALLSAATGWSLGTLIQQRAVTPRSIIPFTCVQMLAGGVFQLTLSGLTGEWSHFEVQQVSLISWFALAYLIVFGSIVAFNCFLWLLTQVPAPAVTTYALVNPVIALVLGSVILDERITPLAWLAALLVLTGVALVLFHGLWARRTV